MIPTLTIALVASIAMNILFFLNTINITLRLKKCPYANECELLNEFDTKK